MFVTTESSPTDKIDASTIDTLQVAQAIMHGKPFAGGAAALRLCEREKFNVDKLAVHMSVCYSPAEIAHMFALTLVTLGAK